MAKFRLCVALCAIAVTEVSGACAPGHPLPGPAPPTPDARGPATSTATPSDCTIA